MKMELPEDLARVVLSFLNMTQMEMEHRVRQLCRAAKRLLRYSPEWLLRIGVKTAKTIRLHPEFKALGKRLSLEKIEMDVTLQHKIMRAVHAGLFARIDHRLRQLQAMYIRRFYRGQTFSVMDRTYMERVITRTEFDTHYAAIIANQSTNRMEDWGYNLSGCLNVSEANHSFGLTI